MSHKEHCKPIALFVLLAIIFNLVPLQTVTAFNPAQTSQNQAVSQVNSNTQNSELKIKIRVDNADKPTLAKLTQNGSRLLEDYDSFSLWLVSEKTANQMENALSVKVYKENITLQKGQLVDKTGQRPVPNNLRQSLSSAPQLWLVQFVGPAKNEWLLDLQKQGFDIIQYIPDSSYLVWGTGETINRLNSTKRVEWNGPYHPVYRLNSNLNPENSPKNGQRMAADTLVSVSVQFYRSADIQKSLARLQALSSKVLLAPADVLKYTNISLEVPFGKLTEIANYPDVVAIMPFSPPEKNDEVQGQIMAGNVTFSGATLPAGPGYLNWLASKGFPTDPAQYPIVDVVDDGVDNGTNTPNHPDFYQFGSNSNPDRLIYNNNCSTDPLADGVDGHGNLNLSIMGGYNNQTGIPYQDSQGYNRGLGINPYGRLAGTKIFNNGAGFNISACGNSINGLVAASYNSGAFITTNSWGSPVGGAYDVQAQAYDALTRMPVNGATREILHIFSAGNSGSNSNTIGSPGTGKNVLTVGAAENVRDNGIIDGCGYMQADNADDIIGFSSRGPTDDGRIKPDIMAAGTHVQGAASAIANYDGSVPCGGAGNRSVPRTPGAKYYPNPAQNGISQTLYTWSSGTSHSTPGVAGAAALLYNYYKRTWSEGQSPSPAMLKALLLNTPRYMTGVGANDTLPSPNQGWGHINLGMTLDDASRRFVDQSAVFTATGQTATYLYQIADSSKPLRVSLAWSDAPGITDCSLCLVNNLDLEVTINGQTYKGNVFNGGTSILGGSADTRNNVENIYLPAGLSGTVAVRVKATGINGDGIPWVNSQGQADQDFALAVYNVVDAPPQPVFMLVNYNLFEVTGNMDEAYDPGETIALEVIVRNIGSTGATALQGTLSLTNGQATLIADTSPFPDIASGETSSNSQLYRFKISPSQLCGEIINFKHSINSNGLLVSENILSMRVGKISASPTVFTRTESPALSIPDGNSVGVTSTLTIGSGPKISKLRVKINELRHSWVGDLQAILTSPSGTSITLFNRPGNGPSGSRADDFINLVLEDSAANPIQNIEDAEIGPISGSYQPLQPLANFIGESSTGSWKLKLVDAFNLDTGQLVSWSLEVFSYTCTSQNCPNPLAVTETGAIESGQVCGTLANAIQTANQTATVNNPVTVTLLINEVFFSNPPLSGLTLNPGVIIYGGECSAAPKMIYATGVAGNLTLEGGVTFKNIWVRSVDQAQFSVSNSPSIGVPNKFICSKVTKT